MLLYTVHDGLNDECRVGWQGESSHIFLEFLEIVRMNVPNSIHFFDAKVDLGNFKTDKKVESRIRRIAAGAGVHPKEVMMLLQVHKQFEGMVGKSKGFFGKGAQAKQQQMAAQMQKNPKLIQQRLNQMV